jgi:3-oxoacyl-[acyl-carrier protein] reductase
VSHTLEGKVALVTGASRGIGRAAAIALAEAGARVAVNHRVAEEEAHDVARAIRAAGGEALAVRADVTEPDDIAAMIERVRGAFGSVDILVNNAGIARPVPLDEVHLATWDATLAVNLTAPFLVSSAVIPAMRDKKWGRLIFISSTAARVGGIVGPHYAASKAGLEGLMRSYASLLVGDGITSNAVAPALIETPMLGGNPRAEKRLVPVGRFGAPEEVAAVVTMLAENAFITGQTVQVNGGIYMT